MVTFSHCRERNNGVLRKERAYRRNYGFDEVAGLEARISALN
jgi:hypothetical protein